MEVAQYRKTRIYHVTTFNTHKDCSFSSLFCVCNFARRGCQDEIFGVAVPFLNNDLYNFEDFFYFHLENMARDCCWSCIEELAVVPPWLDGWDGVIVKMVDPCYTCGKALYDYPGKTWKKVQLSGYRALQCSDCQA